MVADFSDAAASGGSLHGRPGLADCIARGRSGAFAGILVELLDRISRSLADTSDLHRRLTFNGIKLLTVADNGEVPMLMVGVKAALSQQFLVDLAQKTKRGQSGRVRAGAIPGGKSYGYDLVAGDVRGLRTINDREAAIVLRIFTEYAQGRSPLAIVADLNREGVAAPRGGAWNASTLIGSSTRENGILAKQPLPGRDSL